ncbi:hypothetical protein ACHQM5_019885 [Ranunculus cassubicifolius]
MQSKISAFFKPSTPQPPSPSQLLNPIEDTSLFNTTSDPEIRITYTRRTPKIDVCRIDEHDGKDSGELDSFGTVVKEGTKPVKDLNKKRNYAQIYLELGQKDFVLHKCSTCGLKYARGDEGDEEVHKEFHKNYTHGISFKGWRNERVVTANSTDNSRIVLVLDSDPAPQKNKVQEVARIMENELGLSEGWLLHELCKVYLFISARRIAGCLVAEPIRTGYKVVSGSMFQKSPNCSSPKSDKPVSTVLQFGTVHFRREVIRRDTSVSRKELAEDQNGAIFCEEEAVPATCGIRAIWVSPYNRRKHVATKLLDVARTSFCTGYVLEHSQLAFSQPTSVGKALASCYSGTGSFLVYNTGLKSE